MVERTGQNSPVPAPNINTVEFPQKRPRTLSRREFIGLTTATVLATVLPGRLAAEDTDKSNTPKKDPPSQPVSSPKENPDTPNRPSTTSFTPMIAANLQNPAGPPISETEKFLYPQGEQRFGTGVPSQGGVCMATWCETRNGVEGFNGLFHRERNWAWNRFVEGDEQCGDARLILTMGAYSSKIS